MNQGKIILFYSNFCQHCAEFIKKSNQLNIKYVPFCVDNNKKKIPSYVKSVPTLVIPGYSPLVGNNVFNWLNTQTNSNQQNNQNNNHQNNQQHNYQNNQQNNRFNSQIDQQSNNQQNNQQSNQSELQTGDISAYYANEMGSMFSDSFSFLDSDDTKQGDTISHTNV